MGARFRCDPETILVGLPMIQVKPMNEGCEYILKWIKN